MQALQPNKLRRAEEMRVVYSVAPPAGTTVEDVMKPEFWAHVGQRLRPGDFIEVEPEDMAFFALLRVRDAGQIYANVERVLLTESSSEVAPIEAGEYRIQWAGPAHKFRVMRAADNAIVQAGFSSKGAAMRFIQTMEPVAA